MFPLLLPLATAPLAAPQEPAAAAQEPVQEETFSVQVRPQGAARRLESLYEGALVDAQNGQDFAETPGYRRLLEIVSRYGEEELHAKALRRLDFQDAVAHPDAWRGEIVRVRGLVTGMKAERLRNPIGEHVDVYRALLSEPDGSEGVVVDFLAQPPELEQLRDVADVEGVFYRTVLYEARLGNMRETPYLIARNLRRLDPDELSRRTRWDTRVLILIGAAPAYLVSRILLSLRSRKKHFDADAARAARLLRERAMSAPRPRPPASKP